MATNLGMINQLRASLFQLYCLLSTLNSTQLNKVHQLEKCFMSTDDGKCNHILSKANRTHLPSIIENCSTQELALLVHLSQNNSGSILSIPGLENIDSAQSGAFSSLFRILLLQETLFTSLKTEDIISLKKALPSCCPDELLKLFQQLQVIMISTHPDTIHELYHSLQNNSLKKRGLFYELAGCQQDGTIIQQVLGDFFELPLPQLLHFFEVIPNFQGIQLVQIVKLMQMNIIDILETRKLLAPQNFNNSGSCKDEEMEDCDKDDESECNNNHNAELTLELLERFPDQAVYKRNLRPYPSVMITSQNKQHSEKLLYRVVPIIYRCDTLEEIPNSLVGDHSQTGTVGSILKFKKLKIQLTSRQVNDALFCIRFELHKNSRGSTDSPIDVAQSTPIQIVSHSSLIVKTSQEIDKIGLNEIIPAIGGTEGNVRVALLGKNFPDSAFVYVTFDGIEVPCESYGPNTIICFTPPHYQGKVTVSICDRRQNNSNAKKSSQTFEYIQSPGRLETFSGYDCSSLAFPDDYAVLRDLDICSPEFNFLITPHNMT